MDTNKRVRVELNLTVTEALILFNLISNRTVSHVVDTHEPYQRLQKYSELTLSKKVHDNLNWLNELMEIEIAVLGKQLGVDS